MMALVATCATRADDVPVDLAPARAAYTYDDAGRLSSVTDARGRTAVYEYDEVGNLVSVSRGSAAPSEVRPQREARPRVTDLSTTVVAPGDTLTVSGRRFDAPVVNVLFGDAVYGRVESASDTELTVTVPPLAPAGPLAVGTPAGSGESAEDVFVVPPGLAADDVSDTGRVRLGRSVALTLDGEGSVALAAFRGRAGQRVSVRLPRDAEPYALCAFGIGLVGPDGTTLRQTEEHATTCESNQLELPTLPSAGIYTLLAAPDDADAPSRVRLVVDEVPPDTPLPSSDDEEAEEAEEPADVELPPELDLELLEPPELEDPGASAAPGGVLDGAAAFPVDLTTGYGSFLTTDLVVPGAVPLAIARGYKMTGTFPTSLDTGAFGLGADLDLHLNLRTSPGFQFAEVLTGNGVSVVGFVRTSDGVGFTDAVLEHRATPSVFYGARMTWHGSGWDIALVDGTTLVFAGKRESPLTAIRDHNGNQITLLRELDERGRARGNVLAALSPSGGWLEFSYDDEDRIVSVVDQLGRTTTYGYDDPSWRGRLATVAYADGSAVSYSYDSENRLVSVTGPGGVGVVTNSFDDAGRVVRQVLGDGSAFSFAYTRDAEGRVTQTEVTDPSGLVRRLAVSSGQWVADTWAAGTAAESTVQVERDPTSHFVTAVVGPDGRRDAFSYDSAGNMVTSTAAEGSASPFGASFSYSDGVPQVASARDEGGSSSFRYDSAGNLTTAVDAYGGSSRFRYDQAGRLVRFTDAAGGTTRIAYDGPHRVTVTDPAGGRRSEFYDAAGRLAAVTDAVGNQTLVSYDDADRVVSVVDGAGGASSFAYDAVGNLAAVEDAAGNRTIYRYDAAGRVTARTSPGGATESYAYDAAGNVVSHTDRRGVVSTFAYDGLGRLAGASFGGESTVSYGYDPAGRLVTVDDSAYGAVRLGYDELDRLVASSSPQGEVTYAYDAAGRQTATAVAGGPSTSYEYDGSGLLASISQEDGAAVSFERDSLGRATAVSLPNDVTGWYAYDERGMVSEISYGESLGRLGYRYDAAGRRLADVGELAGTALPESVPSELSYDAAGNLVSDGTNTYRWDARGQLVGIDGPVPASFTYDPFGRRATKTVDGVTTTYLYDGANILQSTTGADPPVTYLTGLAADQIYARTMDGSTTSYVRDGLGSVVGLVDESGEMSTSYRYTPFGQTTVDGDESDPNPFAFTARERDETGLYYYRARYYSPEQGRFLSEDPLGFAGGDLNLLAYVGNTPTNFTDPSGLQAFTCVGPALDLFLEAMRLFDQLLLIYRTPGITESQINIATDNILNQVNSARTAFYIACGAEILIIPGLTAIVGRGLSWFGRTPTGQRAVSAFASRFPQASTRLGLGQAGRRAAAEADDLADEVRRVTYRGDSRPPSEIFSEGFRPIGDDLDLLAHAEGGTNSGYVATSLSRDVADDFGPPVYEIRAPGGLDVNDLLGANSPYPYEMEIAYPGGVIPCYIVGCTTATGNWIPNPGYRP